MILRKTARSPRRQPPKRAYRRAGHHLLDVRVRARTARRKRNQRIVSLLSALMVVWAIGAGLWFGGKEFCRYFLFENSEYALRQIDLELDGVMTRAEFLETTGIREGLNLFTLNLDRIERTLRRDSAIASVRLQRDLPDRLAVELVARDPVAWLVEGRPSLNAPGAPGSLLVGPDRILMRPPGDHLDFLHLPVITGLPDGILVEGNELTHEETLEALELLDTNGRFPGSLFRVRALDVSRGYRIEATDLEGAEIIFGTSDFEEQLVRLNKLLEHCETSGREIESVNLMVRKNIPVKFVLPNPPEGGAQAATSPH